jgi:2-haloacid dehalogenase
MLDVLVRNSGLDQYLAAVISVDAGKAFKPDPRAYGLVEAHLRCQPQEVAFVSSNGFDIAGAGSFGFKVVRIERVTPAALFRALRTQTEALGFEPHAVVSSLLALPGVVESLARAG